MKKSGFTLIELIFVIVIIGLLAAVAVPKFLTTKKNAETANLPSVANQIVTKATEQYSLVQETNLSKIIKEDPDLNRYVTKEVKLPFKVASNTDSNFTIEYTGADGTKTYTCLSIIKETVPVRVSATTSVNAYDFNITDLNTSCNQD